MFRRGINNMLTKFYVKAPRFENHFANSYLKYRNQLNSLQFEYALVYSRNSPKGFGRFERNPDGSKTKPVSRKTPSAQKSSEIDNEEEKTPEDIKKQWKEDTWGDLGLESEKQTSGESSKQDNENNSDKESKKEDQEKLKKKDSLGKIKKNLKYFSENRKKTGWSARNKSKNDEEKKDDKQGSNKKKSEKDNEAPNDDKPNDKKMYLFTIFTAGLLGNFIMNRIMNETYEENISYAEIEKLVLADNIEKIVMRQINISGESAIFADFYIKKNTSDTQEEGGILSKISSKSNTIRSLAVLNPNSFLATLEEIQTTRLNKEPDNLVPVEMVRNRDVSDYFSTTVLLLRHMAVIGLMVWSVKNFTVIMKEMTKTLNKFQNKTKSSEKKFDIEKNIKIRFSDVAGLENGKLEIKEFVDFLKYPQKYKNVGAKLPTGALQSGPPGTGKTLLAKAVAGESGVPFFYTSGSEFVEMYVGLGASRVRDLFKKAKENSPSIIFIDEIDAIGKTRATGMGGNSESDNTLNQLLVELDGFGSDENVVVFAATNRKDVLDEALTRPGRFDRNIEVTTPDIAARIEIFKVHLKNIVLDTKVRSFEDYAKRLASLTPGFSGADISNVCNEAAIVAAREEKEAVTPKDFEMAVERIMAGLERKTLINASEKRIVAIHESGHAIASWFLESGLPLLKVTIIPRTKGSLGYAQYLPKENSLQTKEELLETIIIALGGRVAEEILLGEVTTGAQNDQEKAYRIAFQMVTKLGMTTELNNISLDQNQYGIKNYSQYTNYKVDMEIHKIIEDCSQKCREIIETHKQDVENLAGALIENETLDLGAITKILGERPYPMPPSLQEIINFKDIEESENEKVENSENIDSNNDIPLNNPKIEVV